MVKFIKELLSEYKLKKILILYILAQLFLIFSVFDVAYVSTHNNGNQKVNINLIDINDKPLVTNQTSLTKQPIILMPNDKVHYLISTKSNVKLSYQDSILGQQIMNYYKISNKKVKNKVVLVNIQNNHLKVHYINFKLKQKQAENLLQKHGSITLHELFSSFLCLSVCFIMVFLVIILIKFDMVVWNFNFLNFRTSIYQSLLSLYYIVLILLFIYFLIFHNGI